MIGIIGGSGLYDPKLLQNVSRKKVSTEFGEPSDEITLGEFSGKKIAFLPRHGEKHEINPSNVNYRANIWALKELGVTQIIAVNAVGSLQLDVSPETLVFPEQFIDFTKKRESTFFDGKHMNGKVAHINVSNPFCHFMLDLFAEKAKQLKLKYRHGGTYVCIEGPRFSTNAESEFFRQIKGDVIGMTLCPEAVLAKEAELCYANIAAVTDYDNLSDKPISTKEIIETMKKNTDSIKVLLEKIIPLLKEKDRGCGCDKSLEGALF